jgi:Protein of unknown function (DUF3293)
MTTNRRLKFAKIYIDTNYFVSSGETPFRFRIGETNLDKLLSRFEATTWAFVTADNPYSEQLSAAENKIRQMELIELIKSKNLQFLEGFGESSTPDWEDEICVFIFDTDLKNAIEIGKHFEQNAIVYGELGGVPQLIWCV